MEKLDTRRRIWKLLDDIVRDFPRRKEEAESYMAKQGPFDPLEIAINPPEAFDTIPTFSSKATYSPTEMLRARFEYASTVDTGWYLWLGTKDMMKWIKKRSIRIRHTALRGHYEGSAPMLFSDNKLSLFGVTPGVPDVLIYLAWKDEISEPEVWSYDNYEFNRFPNLEQYLYWYLTRP